MVTGKSFRSGLERIWSEYLSANGIEWEYEPVKFGEGRTYTPDFRLKGLPVYLECKGYNGVLNPGIYMVPKEGAALIAVYGYPTKVRHVTVWLPTATQPKLFSEPTFFDALYTAEHWIAPLG